MSGARRPWRLVDETCKSTAGAPRGSPDPSIVADAQLKRHARQGLKSTLRTTRFGGASQGYQKLVQRQ